MPGFAIFSDSACDLPAALAKQRDIRVIPMKVSFDRETMLYDGVDINNGQFYAQLKTAARVPKTYFPTVRENVKAFKEALDAGLDVLSVTLSSKLSKAYEAAVNAQKILSYIYKDRRIFVVDSLMASGGQALLLLEAARLRDASADIKRVYELLNETKKQTVTIFVPSSLEQLAKGGRISAATATIGNLIKMNPILYVENGALVSKSKAIGRAKALNAMKQLAIKEIGGRAERYRFVVFHSCSRQEADAIERDLVNGYNAEMSCPPFEIGATVGAHAGGGTVGVSCVPKLI